MCVTVCVYEYVHVCKCKSKCVCLYSSLQRDTEEFHTLNPAQRGVC
uniref:Uncharacterized protein n=1 Tax=Anguilla anguilla TaxID=7936 RepID=A0A0E9Q3P1_ANGAN